MKPPATQPGNLFRTMLKDGNDRPVCGSDANMLGARVGIDVKPDTENLVHPGKGISVAPNDPVHLPPHLRPEALGGFGRLPVFVLETAKLGTKLAYQPSQSKPERHGEIEPRFTTPLMDYQKALCGTGSDWILK